MRSPLMRSRAALLALVLPYAVMIPLQIAICHQRRCHIAAPAAIIPGSCAYYSQIILQTRGHLLFSNYSWNNLPEPNDGLKFMIVCDVRVKYSVHGPRWSYSSFQVKDTYLSKNEAAKIKDYARRSTFCSVAAIITGIVALLLILMVIILGITGVVGTGWTMRIHFNSEHVSFQDQYQLLNITIIIARPVKPFAHGIRLSQFSPKILNVFHFGLKFNNTTVWCVFLSFVKSNQLW